MSNTNQIKMAGLEVLTRTVTAFGSWGEFKAAMEAGYCPTLRIRKGTGRMQKDQKFFNQCTNKLREMVRAEGFKVYDGKTVA